LRVADNETSKGLVHRYLVLVRQNARRVSIIIFSAATWKQRW
jgi:hypothetical protein